MRMFFGLIFSLVLFSPQSGRSEVANYNQEVVASMNLIADRAMVELSFTNKTPSNIFVMLRPNRNNTVANLGQHRVDVRAGSQGNINIPFSYETRLREQNIFVLHLDVSYVDSKGVEFKLQPIYQLIEKGPRGYQATSETKVYSRAFAPLTVNGRVFSGEGQIDRGANFQEQVFVPEQTIILASDSDLDPQRLPRVEIERGGLPRDMANALPVGNLPRSSSIGASPKENALVAYPKSTCIPGPNCKMGALFYSYASSFFSSSKLSSGWGFTVEYWELDGIPLAKWNLIGSSEVRPDGLWYLIPKKQPKPNTTKAYIFRMGNRFVNLLNPAVLDKNFSPTPYTWTTVVTPKQLPNGTWEEATPFKVVSLPLGVGAGLHNILNTAMRLWARLVEVNVNPVSLMPIKFHFPNSFSNSIWKCTSTNSSGTAIPWSCSTGAFGDIWLIPEHADWDVPVHELAHTINKFHWKGVPVPGAGGAHFADRCYNPGLTMMEGFANFLPLWLRYERTEKLPWSIVGNIETYSRECPTGQMNEMAVAATFWDLYDTQIEVATNNRYDVVNFGDAGGVVSEYLNGHKNSMTDYRKKLLNNHNTQTQQWINDLFRLNYTFAD